MQPGLQRVLQLAGKCSEATADRSRTLTCNSCLPTAPQCTNPLASECTEYAETPAPGPGSLGTCSCKTCADNFQLVPASGDCVAVRGELGVGPAVGCGFRGHNDNACICCQGARTGAKQGGFLIHCMQCPFTAALLCHLRAVPCCPAAHHLHATPPFCSAHRPTVPPRCPMPAPAAISAATATQSLAPSARCAPSSTTARRTLKTCAHVPNARPGSKETPAHR